jgi:Bacterial Ig-like domain (group 3)
MANQYFRRRFKRLCGSVIETLESRKLLSESATAQLSLVSTTGTVATPVYNYDITLTNNGTTNIGTFWFAWVPGEDFLPVRPSAESSPANWGNGANSSTPNIEGSGNSSDGISIQWIAKSNALLAAGQSLSGFDFSTTDSPTVLAGNSTQHPGNPAMTSFVYEGQPFSDNGVQFTVAPAVTPAASTTTLMTSAPSINLGGSITLTATVASSSGTGAVPTGSATFFDGTTNLGSSTLTNGVGTLNTSSLPVGTDSLTAEYGGDTNYFTSTSAAVSESVVALPASTTTVTTSAPSITVGGSLTLTATVASSSGTGAVPTGSVTFFDGSTNLGIGTLSNGIGTLTSSSLPVGTDSLTAQYSGDSNYSASTSAVVSESVVALPASTTTLVTSAPSITAGDSLTLTATVASSSGAGAVPTGSVNFFDGTTNLGSGTLTNGTASLTTTALPVGADSLTAQYSGDTNYSASTSSEVSESVVAAPVETASAVMTLTSTTGTLLNPIYNYNITLTNTGNVNLGTFWFAWVPHEDFLPTSPISITSPAGWGNAAGTSSTPVITHETTSPDGFAIQWVAQSSGAALTPGQSLSGFTFSSSDSPIVLNGTAPAFPNQQVLTSFVYGGAPLSDAGDQFNVVENITPPTSGFQPTIVETNLPSFLVVGSKSAFTVPVTLSNLNASKTIGNTTTTLFASIDGALDGTQIPIGTLKKKLTISGNGTLTVDVKVSKLPTAVTAGTYHIIASTTDAQNNTLSTITTGTITVAPPTINFSMTATPLTLGSQSAGAKTSAKAVLSVTNTGNVISKGSSTIQLFAATDQTATSGTPIVTKKASISVKPGASKTESIHLKIIPSTLAPATYFVIAEITDPQGHITFAPVSSDLVITG